MDLLEKINRSFGTWYEGLFGGADDVRPKDILRRILAAMEDHRKEGFDSRVYVPNQFILEINVDDDEEKEYLLSFLDRDELEAAIRRYCQQNKYHIRGALDFTIKEVEDADLGSGKRGEKVRVRCRYNTKITEPEGKAKLEAIVNQESGLPDIPVEDRTVASLRTDSQSDEGGTVPSVAAASLLIYAPDRAPFRYAIARGAVTIGRSPKSGNDVVIESDGQISKKHARLELDPDGKFTIYDLGSTNGTKVNGRRVENRTLHDGDEIMLGATRLTFQQSYLELSIEEREAEAQDNNGARTQGVFGGAAASAQDSNGKFTPRLGRPRAARLVLMQDEDELDDYLLASETVIGRGVTNDIVLPDRSIATRHARIVQDGGGYAIETLGDAATALNGEPLTAGSPTRLEDGDLLTLGSLTLRFDGGR